MGTKFPLLKNVVTNHLDIGPLRRYYRSVMDITQSQPLTPAVFHLLLALSRGEKHGYELMKSVREDSSSKVKMGNGTLYGSLKRMMADGLIEDAGERAEGDDTRRKYYKLTALGQNVLTAEIDRYMATSEVIKKYQKAPTLLEGNLSL